MSLRLRLFLLVLVLFTGALVAAGVVVASLVRGYLVDRLDADLPRAQLVAVGAANGFLPPAAEWPDRPDAVATLDVGAAYIRVYDAEGAIEIDRFVDEDQRRQRPDLPRTADGIELGAPYTVDGTGDGAATSYRVMASQVLDGRTVVTALPLTEVSDAVAEVVAIEIAVGAALLAVVAAGAWWVVGLGLRPLRAMEETAESIRAGGFEGADRKRRVAHPSPRTELGQLGQTLNGMLDEIDAAFERRHASESRLRQFVADASHELRTPLTSIRGYAQLVRRAPEDAAQLAASVARIESESVRMTHLVEDLLVLARLDEHPPLRRDELDVARLVEDVVGDARAADPGRSIVAVDHRRRPTTVVADRPRLAQAIVNLVTNARVHTPATTPIEVVVDGDGHEARIAVVDHGCGVHDADRERIFDRFARIDAGRSRDAGGAGLGLAIAMAVAVAHGGTITIGNTPGGGATFTLTVPSRRRFTGVAQDPSS